MLYRHRNRVPRVAAGAYVAPNAVLCGDVTIGDESRVLFGATIVADGGPVIIGSRVIVMEGAVIRGRPEFPTRVGDHVLIGPHAHVNGVTIDENCFIATGASLFPGASLGAGSVVRINGVVHIKTALPAGSVVPIGWIAIGDKILPPGEDAEITPLLRELDFAATAFGLVRDATGDSMMPKAMRHYAEWFGEHASDSLVHGRSTDG